MACDVGHIGGFPMCRERDVGRIEGIPTCRERDVGRMDAQQGDEQQCCPGPPSERQGERFCFLFLSHLFFVFNNVNDIG
jgi:hypothetical protein